MPKLEEAIKFCQEARNILGTPGYRYGTYDTEESKAAKKALDAVTIKLAALKKKNPRSYELYEKEFSDLSVLGQRAKASNDKSLALTLTAQLVYLGKRIDYVSTNVDLRTSLSTLTTTVEKIYQDDLKAANGRKEELALLKKDYTTIYGGPFNFDAAILRKIENAEYVAKEATSARPEERPTSFTNAIGWLEGVKDEHSNGLKLHTDYEAYKAKMDQAEKYRVELFLLSTVEHDYSKTFTDAMDAAREDASNKSPYDFKAAVTKLNGVISTYNTLKKEADAAKGKKELEAAQKPIYNDKVRRIENDIRELKALPGTQSAVTQLEGKLKAGRIAAETGDYELARQSLKGSNEAHENGKKAADNFKKTMDPGYKTELEKTNAELELCEKLVGRSQSQTIAGYRKEIDANVFAFSNQPATLPTAKDGLISIFERLVVLKGNAEKERGDCITKRDEASGKIEKFQERYLIANYDVLPLFRQAESEFAVDNYDEAKTLYEVVTSRLLEILGAG